MKKRNKEKPNNNKLLFSMPCMPMLKNLVGKTVMIPMMMIQPTKSVHISSKVFAKKERNVFTHMILHSIELNKSICMSIKELSWLWTLLEAKKWVNFQKMTLTNFWVKNNLKWWKVPDLKLCVNSFWKLLKKASTVGNGIVQMVILANISIVFLQDIYLERMKKVNLKFKLIKFQFNKKSMLRDMNLWLKIKEVNILFKYRSFGYFWSIHEVEGRKKNQKRKRSWIKEKRTWKEERKRTVEDWCLTFQVRSNSFHRWCWSRLRIRAIRIRWRVRRREVRNGWEGWRRHRVN